MKQNDADKKQEKLFEDLKSLQKVAVAFSAGVDSTFLLKSAHEVLGNNVIAITGHCASFPGIEGEEAGMLCKAWGIEQIVVDVDQMAIPGFAENPPDRCYLCKKALFSAFLDAAGKRGFACLVEGSNADDTGDYRPGMRAIAELGVKSPLRDAGLTKQEIRFLSEKMGLPTWNKPSLACLATRLPYGERITAQKLQTVDQAEQMLRSLKFSQVRVRMHGEIARIEVVPSEFEKLLDPELRAEICRRFHDLGFLYVTLDLDGYATGSMNRVLASASDNP